MLTVGTFRSVQVSDFFTAWTGRLHHWPHWRTVKKCQYWCHKYNTCEGWPVRETSRRKMERNDRRDSKRRK